MVKTRDELLKNLEKITSEIANLKKIIILEFEPSPNGKNRAAWNDLQKIINKLSPHWDKITAVEEIRLQREK